MKLLWLLWDSIVDILVETLVDWLLSILEV